MELIVLKQAAFAKEYFHSAAIDVEPIPGSVVEEGVEPPKRLVVRVWLVLPGITLVAGGQQKAAGGLRCLSVYEDSARETFDIYINILDALADEGQKLPEIAVQLMWDDVKKIYKITEAQDG